MKSNDMTAKSSPSNRLAVCSWSLQPGTPVELIVKVSATGIRQMQLGLDPLRASPVIWGETELLLRQSQMEIISGMFGCVGEDYSTLQAIRETGGIAPDETWMQNLKNIRETAVIAAKLGLKLVTFHAGFLPHEKSDPGFEKMLDRLETVTEIFGAHKIALGLETGQETAKALAVLLQELDRPNVGVNFDPANMILYDKGDPVAALRVLAPWLRQVHIKDATRAEVPGTWGREVPVGTGDVDWPAFFAALRELNFTGDLVIEREAGEQRVADICTARDLVLRELK
jgi:L-ribulose-5-phosphate 3-epimerase